MPQDELDSWITVTQAGREVGKSDKWVADRIKSSTRYELRLRPNGPGRGYPSQVRVMSPRALKYIRGAARRSFKRPVLGTYITLVEACKLLGCSEGWIIRHLKGFGYVQMPIRRNDQNLEVRCMSVAAFTYLVTLRGQPPPAGWLSEYELKRRTGFRESRIRATLLEIGIRPKRFVNPVSGKPTNFYPPTSETALQTRPRHPPAGDWLTKQRLADALCRGVPWVETHLAKLGLDGQRLKLLDDTGKPCWHYPPAVFRRLDAIPNPRRRGQDTG